MNVFKKISLDGSRVEADDGNDVFDDSVLVYSDQPRLEEYLIASYKFTFQEELIGRVQVMNVLLCLHPLWVDFPEFGLHGFHFRVMV